MINVDQTIVEKGDGDCFRAAVASILDLTIEQVPHFNRFGQAWHSIYRGFLMLCGWEYSGCCDIRADRGMKEEDSINGFFIVAVPSATFEGVMHSVISDLKGIVVHDPNPNKKWQGRNIKEGSLVYWHMFDRVDYE